MKNKFTLIIFIANTVLISTIHSMNLMNSGSPKKPKKQSAHNIYVKHSDPEQTNASNTCTQKASNKPHKIVVSLPQRRSSVPHNRLTHTEKKERPRSQSYTDILSLSRTTSIGNFSKKTSSSDSSLMSSPRADGDNETLLIQTIRSKNFSQNNPEHIEKIKEILKHENVDINHKNKWGNTALHYTGILCLPKVAVILISDIRTNTNIKNNSGLRAHDCLHEESFTEKQKIQETKSITVEELRKMFFARITLDLIVEEESFHILVTEKITREKLKKLTDEKEITPFLDNILTIVKARVEKDNQNQKHYQEIPKECRLPEYATDDFIKNMIRTSLYDNSF